MAKKSLGQQFAELREYAAKLEIELAGYKAMAVQPVPRSLKEFCDSYCRVHGVGTVPGDVVREARNSGVIA